MSFFKKKKEKIEPERVLEGIDDQWIDALPGEAYRDQDPRLEIGMASRIGTREYQQDALAVRWINGSLLIAMMCDGMGGLDGGETASRYAITSVMTGIEKLGGSLTSDELFDVIRETNDGIRNLENDEGEPLSCGTTMTLLIVRGELAVWMSIGDSRIYYLSGEGLRCVTKEHNYAFLMEMRQKEEERDITIDESIRQDTLVSYLGAPEVKYIDYNTVPWKMLHNDTFLLCSDGLVKLLSDERIEEIIADRDEHLDAMAATLVDEASSNADPRQDNTTVIMVRFKEK